MMKTYDLDIDDDFRARCLRSMAGDYYPETLELLLGMPPFRGSLVADIAEFAGATMRVDDVYCLERGRSRGQSHLYDAADLLGTSPTRGGLHDIIDALEDPRQDFDIDGIRLRAATYLALLGDEHAPSRSFDEVISASLSESVRRPERRVAYTLAASGWSEISALCRDGNRTRPGISERGTELDELSNWYRSFWNRSVINVEARLRETFARIPPACARDD